MPTNKVSMSVNGASVFQEARPHRFGMRASFLNGLFI